MNKYEELIINIINKDDVEIYNKVHKLYNRIQQGGTSFISKKSHLNPKNVTGLYAICNNKTSPIDGKKDELNNNLINVINEKNIKNIVSFYNTIRCRCIYINKNTKFNNIYGNTNDVFFTDLKKKKWWFYYKIRKALLKKQPEQVKQLKIGGSTLWALAFGTKYEHKDEQFSNEIAICKKLDKLEIKIIKYYENEMQWKIDNYIMTHGDIKNNETAKKKFKKYIGYLLYNEDKLKETLNKLTNNLNNEITSAIVHGGAGNKLTSKKTYSNILTSLEELKDKITNDKNFNTLTDNKIFNVLKNVSLLDNRDTKYTETKYTETKPMTVKEQTKYISAHKATFNSSNTSNKDELKNSFKKLSTNEKVTAWSKYYKHLLDQEVGEQANIEKSNGLIEKGYHLSLKIKHDFELAKFIKEYSSKHKNYVINIKNILKLINTKTRNINFNKDDNIQKKIRKDSLVVNNSTIPEVILDIIKKNKYIPNQIQVIINYFIEEKLKKLENRHNKKPDSLFCRIKILKLYKVLGYPNDIKILDSTNKFKANPKSGVFSSARKIRGLNEILTILSGKFKELKNKIMNRKLKPHTLDDKLFNISLKARHAKQLKEKTGEIGLFYEHI